MRSPVPGSRTRDAEWTLACGIGPGGSLVLHEESPDTGPVSSPRIARRIREAFESGRGAGVLHLGAAEPDTPLHETLAFWRDLGRTLVAGVCAGPISDNRTTQSVSLTESPAWESALLAAPPMRGGEFLSPKMLEDIWREATETLRARAEEHSGDLSTYLASLSSVWNLIGRVCLHLAEVKRSPEAPFAFLATHVHAFSASGSPAHRPLGNALSEYAGNAMKLHTLLAPVSRACKECEVLQELVRSGRLYHPLAWSAENAH